MTNILDRTAEAARQARQATVSVDGVVIPQAEIAREAQLHPAERHTDALQAAAQALVVRQLLLREAVRTGLEAEPLYDGDGRYETDDEARIRTLIERQVEVPEADEATCRRWYEQNPASFRTPDLYEVRHVLLPAAIDDAEARDRAHARARAIIALLAFLKPLPKVFSFIAKAESACPSATDGGCLGQIGPGQTVPEFERALPHLPVGIVSPEPVETRYGVHVVYVERRIPGCMMPFEAVRQRIADWLGTRIRHVATRHYLASLAARAEIRGVEMPATGPLLQ
ncbi:MAG: peptidylprolyl isomerase [Geminicoccaceae bacterium]